MPLRYLFVDLNAYFASVEQQDDKALRGKPVVVVPVLADTTCCIAVSYETRKFGVKTGTPVWEARRKCPGLILRVGRHERYVEIHHEIVRAVGRCIPVLRVMSIDEMACKLLGDERLPGRATGIAGAIKAEIRKKFDYLACSIGVGPNVMLAKVAGDMQKPDGLTLLDDADLPGKLRQLKLTDFPGIGPRMEVRLHRSGVRTVEHLLALSPAQMCHVWGSRVHGWRWWYLLRGEDVSDGPTKRRTVGHSHVLPPELRSDGGAYGVLVKLIHKAAARLRDIEYWTGKLAVGVRYEDGSRWDADSPLPRCQDTLALLRRFGDLWAGRPAGRRPKKVGMLLSDLVPAQAVTPSLFAEERQLTALSHVMDSINRAFGKGSVRFGGVCGSEDTAPTRVAFTRIPDFNPATE